jgi:aminoglycoside 6'-N-acetyltransferase
MIFGDGTRLRPRRPDVIASIIARKRHCAYHWGMPQPYDFRSATKSDLPMLRRWLGTREVKRWWGDSDKEYAILEDDLANPAMRMWIVLHETAPFAYLQDYDPRAWELVIPDIPPGARGIDQFIGVPEMINRGHGSALIRAHAENLLEKGAPAVFTDPDPLNARAIRAYASAGFQALGVRELTDGPCFLMARFGK